jgi:hypothetical protein
LLRVRCYRQNLDPHWKVVPALIANIAWETTPDVVLADERNLVQDLDYKDVPFRRCHIPPPDNAFAITSHRTRRVKVNAHIIPHCDLLFSYSPLSDLVALGVETPKWQLGCD